MNPRLLTPLLCALFAAGVNAQEVPVQPNAGFVKLDTNKDGFLSQAEAGKDKVLRKNFAAADLNHDGKLNEDEYIKAISAYQRGEAKEYAGDSALTAKVKGVLLTTDGVPSAKISVASSNGRVRLSGSLDSKEEIDKAVKTVKAVGGVKSVENHLKVK